MKKTSQKIFSKVTALMLAAVSTLGGFAKAEKPPLLRGDYRVFNVAIIGSDVVEGRAGEESTDFNKNVMKNLCDVGARLENFAEVGALGENKISFAGRELPRSSMILPEQHIIFCFYDVANLYDPEVIRECPFALCPYTLNLSESYDAWETRMTRLRDFVKTRNEMCDLRFLGVIHGGYNEAAEKYSQDTLKIADERLDIYGYEQTVIAWCLSPHANYPELIASCVRWGRGRESEFKQCTGKNFPVISYQGMNPAFFQEGEVHSIATPPIVPRVQPTRPVLAQITPTRPTSQTIAPKSKASEGSKKKSEQMPDYSRSSRRRSNGVDCGGLYKDCFILPQSNGSPTLICDSFRKILKILLDCGFYSNEIIDGFKTIKFDGTRLKIEFEKFWFFRNSRGGEKYPSPKEAYKDIFVSEKNKSIYKKFVKAFQKCIGKGAEPGQIVMALQNLQYKDPEDYSDNITVYSGVIETTRKEGGVGCNI